jgi:hypothetical protein
MHKCQEGNAVQILAKTERFVAMAQADSETCLSDGEGKSSVRKQLRTR